MVISNPDTIILVSNPLIREVIIFSKKCVSEKSFKASDVSVFRSRERSSS